MDEIKPSGKKTKKKTSKIKSNFELLMVLFVLIKTHKKWWLLPLLIVLAFLSLFVTLSGNQSVLPAIYALF
ncbi:hypothetical protein J7K25_03720 [bacterium]|nr:hypothetical protein [bacterium]